jgi:hypothetical protein
MTTVVHQPSYRLARLTLLFCTGALAAPTGAANANSSTFIAQLLRVVRHNRTLHDWFLPKQFEQDLEKNWVPFSKECKYSDQCHCNHVAGESAEVAGDSAPANCERIVDAKNGSSEVVHNCETKRFCKCYTGHGQPCLFGHMSPTKLLLVIAAARASGVRTIIEEGREGGISAFFYAQHGFDVISVEYLPLKMVKRALSTMAPRVRQLDGDGSVIVPQLVGDMTSEDAAKTLVVFDGEKRDGAYETFSKIAQKVAVAVFDDTNVDRSFRTRLIEPAHKAFVDTEGFAMHHRLANPEWSALSARKIEVAMLKEMIEWAKTSPIWGYAYNYSKEHFDHSHFIIVPGGRWARAAAGKS